MDNLSELDVVFADLVTVLDWLLFKDYTGTWDVGAVARALERADVMAKLQENCWTFKPSEADILRKAAAMVGYRVRFAGDRLLEIRRKEP